jgi:predicted transport protein
VIIEYKRDRSFSVIDQGYAYLALLLNDKAEFVLKYNEKTGKSMGKNDFDWSQSRVVFVAHSFTTHQQQAINFRDLPIELWEVSLYDNNTVLFNQLKASKSSESIKTISKNSTIQKVNSEVKVFSADDHFTGPKESSRELYELLRDKLKTLDSRLQENPRKSYIGYALGENGLNTLVYVHPQTNGLRFDIPGIYPKNVTDPLSKVVYQEKSLERFNTPLSIMYAINEADVDYAISILKMALQYRFSN